MSVLSYAYDKHTADVERVVEQDVVVVEVRTPGALIYGGHGGQSLKVFPMDHIKNLGRIPCKLNHVALLQSLNESQRI